MFKLIKKIINEILILNIKHYLLNPEAKYLI